MTSDKVRLVLSNGITVHYNPEAPPSNTATPQKANDLKISPRNKYARQYYQKNREKLLAVGRRNYTLNREKLNRQKVERRRLAKAAQKKVPSV